MSYNDRSATASVGPRSTLTAALILLGLAFPATAQNSAPDAGTFVGLPPPSKLIGPLRLMPDGTIAVVPESTRPPAPHPPAYAPALPKLVGPPENIVAKPAVTVVKPHTPPATPSDPAPPPRATVVSQIHNAPGWQPTHTYHYATGPYTRVVNGPGWTPAKSSDRSFLYGIRSSFGRGQGEPDGHYHPGRTLDAYQLTSTGTCTSALHGGPTGTGAAIKDGTCTWKYLSRVDYISLTGWASDNQRWKKGTTYHYFDYVTSDSPLRAYALADDSCTSTVAPTGSTGTDDGTTGLKFRTSDGCHWDYMADILYSSEKSYIPTVTFTSSKSPATIQMKTNYEAMLWNDREYVAGKNGERSPISCRPRRKRARRRRRRHSAWL